MDITERDMNLQPPVVEDEPEKKLLKCSVCDSEFEDRGNHSYDCRGEVVCEDCSCLLSLPAETFIVVKI